MDGLNRHSTRALLCVLLVCKPVICMNDQEKALGLCGAIDSAQQIQKLGRCKVSSTISKKSLSSGSISEHKKLMQFMIEFLQYIFCGPDYFKSVNVQFEQKRTDSIEGLSKRERVLLEKEEKKMRQEHEDSCKKISQLSAGANNEHLKTD